MRSSFIGSIVFGAVIITTLPGECDSGGRCYLWYYTPMIVNRPPPRYQDSIPPYPHPYHRPQDPQKIKNALKYLFEWCGQHQEDLMCHPEEH